MSVSFSIGQNIGKPDGVLRGVVGFWNDELEGSGRKVSTIWFLFPD